MTRKKLNDADRSLYRAVDEVLHYLWDPIGVSDIPEARDEYHGYLPQVFSLLRNGGKASEIAQYLSAIATEQMGLTENTKHDLVVCHC